MRRSLLLFSLLFALPVCLLSAQAFEDIRAAAVPGLAVRADGRTGVVHYIVIQITTGAQQDGPVVQFSEINLGGGSAVGEDWKDGVRGAVKAALRELAVDGRDWVVTVKNRSYNAVTDGASASGAVAVGIVAAWRGETPRPGVAMTGQISPDGRILPVGNVPQKVEAAAGERFKTVLVPSGQMYTEEWDLTALAGKLGVTIIEVRTLDEAYRAMVQGR
ncbi:MAG TPA: S16 family serine protease [Nitrospira sp.]|nr:S16 family serine protease [Nitrospira sp.]